MKFSQPRIYYLLPFLFIGLLLLPIFNKIVPIWQFERKSENRAFKDSITVDFSHLDRFPSDFKAYYNDNFSFRTPLLELYHHLKFYYFGISPHPDQVIIGKNNWFFRAGKEKEIYQGKLDFTDENLKDFKKEWLGRKRYLDSLGIKFYWLIAPMKHSIYPEELPFNIARSRSRRISLLKDYFDEFMPELIVDPVPDLLKEKQNRKLFFQLDNHWNHQAGLVASNVLINRIKKDFPDKEIVPISSVNWKDTILQEGIHYRVLGIDALSENETKPMFTAQAKSKEKYGFPPTKGFAYPWEYEYRYENKNIEKGLRVLVIRDSFFGQMMPFFVESFAETSLIFDAWQYQLHKEIIEKVKPDIVVFECLEVHVENILKN